MILCWNREVFLLDDCQIDLQWHGVHQKNVPWGSPRKPPPGEYQTQRERDSTLLQTPGEFQTQEVEETRKNGSRGPNKHSQNILMERKFGKSHGCLSSALKLAFDTGSKRKQSDDGTAGPQRGQNVV